MKRTYAVMGATGHIGTVLTQQLLKKGHKVKAIGRDPSKLNALKALGADIVIIKDFNLPDALTAAFKGADAVFSFIPPGYDMENFTAYQNQVGEAIKTAIEKNHIPYVVNLSSIGAHLPKGTGPIEGLHLQENRLNAIPNLNVLHLRPGYFMENLLWSIPIIKQMGANGSPLKGDLPIYMVATEDIGIKAAEFLDRLDFKGHAAFEFCGPRALNLQEATQMIGKSIGKPDLKYIQFPYADGEKGMIASGMKVGTAKLMIDMYKAFNEGHLNPTQQLNSDHTGKTTIEQFSRTFAQHYGNN